MNLMISFIWFYIDIVILYSGTSQGSGLKVNFNLIVSRVNGVIGASETFSLSLEKDLYFEMKFLNHNRMFHHFQGHIMAIIW